MSNLWRFSVGKKLSLIGFAYTLPIGVLLYLLVGEKNAAIDFAQRERDGVRYLEQPVEILRRLSDRRDAETTANVSQTARTRVELDSAFQRLETVDRELAERVKTTPSELGARRREALAPANLKRRFRALEARSQAGGQDGEREYEGVRADVRGLVAHVGDTSNLILDPDLDTYYTMDAVLVRLPEGFDLLSDMTHALDRAKGGLSGAERRRLIEASGAVRANVAATADSLARAFGETGNFNASTTLRARLTPLLEDYRTKSEAFMTAVNALLDAENVTGAATVAEAGRAAQAAGERLWTPAAIELSAMLEARVRTLEGKRNASLWTVAGTVLAVGLLTLLLALGISRRVVALCRWTAELARGNLSSPPPAGGGSDEIAELERALTDVVVAQRGVAEAARRIADGDISASHEVRSADDVLGASVVRLRDTIALLVGEADRLVMATQRGELGERGDPAHFQGTFAELLSSFNRALDAVKTPIDEAILVLERVANRDLTSSMDESRSEGDYRRMALAINEAVRNLHDGMAHVQSSAEEVKDHSSQIASGGQSLATAATQQAQSLSDAATGIGALLAETQSNARQVTEAGSLVAETRRAILAGSSAMDTMRSVVEQIRLASERTSAIIKDIDDIAFQTNLLALNASVEAARAGDAGRGFAVVANEVRKLSLRAKESAQRTSSLIAESVALSGDGDAKAREVRAELDVIVASIQRFTATMASLTDASRRQTTGIEHLSHTMSEMDKVTQQNAANAEQSSAVAQLLTSQADQMSRLVRGFRLAHA